MDKTLATEVPMYTKQVKSSKSLRLNMCMVLQPANKSSRSHMFFKIGVLKSFAKFTEKHLRQNLFFNKLVASGPQLH